MKRWLLTAALTAAMLAVPVLAQRRGGMAGGGFGRGGFAHAGFAHGSASTARSSGSFGASRFGGVHFGTAVRPRSGYSNRFYHRRFYGNSFYGYPFYGYPWFASYYTDPGFYSDYGYPPADTTYPNYNPAASYFDPNSQYQQSQIDRLEDEVAQLREQRTAQDNSRRNSEPEPATVLVFKDKHSEEVQNYAVVGNTLWIFTEDHARKIPLSDLDIPATQKANDDHGVDFQLPG
jgi:hypothetical protein